MLTSHDDGYTEPVYNTSGKYRGGGGGQPSPANPLLCSHAHRPPPLDLGNESILDDEEEWHAEEGDEEDEADSLVEDDDGAEMVIERPFGEPQAALLELNCSETPLEATTSATAPGGASGDTDELEPISMKNILPPGSRRLRTHPTIHQA